MKFIPALVKTLFVLSAVLSLPATLLAQAQYEFDSDDDHYYIQWNEGEGTPLKELIILCQDVTGYAIQYQEAELQDTRIFIIGKQKIKRSKQGFFAYFQSVLISYEFICAPYGPEDDPFFITIRKMTARPGGGADLFKAQAPVVPKENLAQYKDNPGMLITTTIQLKHIPARDTMTSLQHFFQAAGAQQLESIRPIENSNSLILTGFANKIYYVALLIKLMDVEPIEIEAEFTKRELVYAVAEELEPVLTNLIAAVRNLRPGQPTQPRPQGQGELVEPEPKIIAEPRTNSLLITGSEKMLTKINNWIDVLDVEVDPRGDIHVYRLKNTLAVEMQGVLEEMLRGQQQGGSTRRPPGSSGAGTTTTGIEAPAQVVADEPSNSLVITASKTKYAELIEVIKKLDIRRKQVLIECAIIEVSSRIDNALGIELGGIDLKNSDTASPDYLRPFGFTNFGLSEIITDDNGIPSQRAPSVGSGLTGGIFHGDGFAIPFLLSALARKTDGNILSMPSILTNDNEEATIESLDKEPTFSFQTTQSGTENNSFDDYQEAGITLSISPSISAGNYLKLQIKIKVSDFDDASDVSPPPISERIVETSVTIPDGHTMIVGGVLQDDKTKIENKIPILGDLPLLGWLFRSKSDTQRKTNLYIFITPHIIGDDFANLDDMSYKSLKEVEALKGDVLLIDPDFEYTNAEGRMIDAGTNWIFEIPSYAAPDTGETSKSYIDKQSTMVRPDSYEMGDL